MTLGSFNRRRALRNLASFMAASPLAEAQVGGREPEGHITPREEAVNVFEVELTAQRKLPGEVYRLIAGGDRQAFDRMTFRPRMLINVENLDLTADLFGEKLFAPILLGPVSQQHRFHPEGELAAARGAGQAKTAMVLSSVHLIKPIAEIAAQASAPLWFQIYPGSDTHIADIQQAVAAGCKAVCLTVGVPTLSTSASGTPGRTSVAWSYVEQVRKAIKVPLVLKGIMTPEEATTAVGKGVDGIIVSNHGGMYAKGLVEPIEMLPSIADAVGAKAAVLIDGCIRRGTDALKALALGARAVLVARPAMWGLAAYGADGVQTVLQMLQSELARDMGLCGTTSLKAISRKLVTLHRR